MGYGDNVSPITQTRLRALRLIRNSPGASYSDVVRRLGWQFGQAQHHLYMLERAGLIQSVWVGPYRRYYASDSYPNGSRRPHALLQNPAPRRFLNALAVRPDASMIELAAQLGVSRQAVGYMAHQLENEGVLRIHRRGRCVRFVPVGVAA